MNTRRWGQVVHEELVDAISINYIHDEFHGIKSEDFRAYWVGSIHLPEDETKRIAIHQGRAKTRLIIDGAVVHEGDSTKEILLTLNKGEHRVEIEYTNNWHTTNLSVAFVEDVANSSLRDIKRRLADNISGEYEIYYAGLYQSSSKDHSVILNIEKTTKPVVLVLSSHSPIKWRISNPFMADIRAIVYGHYGSGATVVGDVSKATMVLPSEKLLGSHTLAPKCSCSSGRFHCTGTSILATKTAVEELSEYSMSGFSVRYSAASLRVPEVIVNETFLQELDKNNQERDQLREDCRRQSNPDFERMFERANGGRSKAPR